MKLLPRLTVPFAGTTHSTIRDQALYFVKWVIVACILAITASGANAKVTDEYRLAAAKSYYYRALTDFMKTNGRTPTDDERNLIGYNPKFDDVMTPRERFFERVSAGLETMKTP